MCRHENERLREEVTMTKNATALLEGSVAALRQQLRDSDVRQQTLESLLQRLESNVAAATMSSNSIGHHATAAAASSSGGAETPSFSPVPSHPPFSITTTAVSSPPPVPRAQYSSGKPPRATPTPSITKSTALALFYECQSLLEDDSDIENDPS